ncbi:MAG: DMT family transporter [Peptococcaceae bacterium]|nr:DMT family transporter [Peptococcaceae bacterium]
MKKDKANLIFSMLIFGSMGLVIKKISFGSIQIAWFRGTIGCLFILAVCFLSGKGLDIRALRKNLPVLLISGCFIGANWIMLFNAYKYTDVSIATVCNYMAPVIVTFLSPLLFKERLSTLRVVCVFSAVAGLACLASAGGGLGPEGAKGIAFGLAAAVLYAGMVVCNKFLREISGRDSCAMQLGMAALFLTPFFLAGGGVSFERAGITEVALLLCLGIIHAGVAFLLYFTAIPGLPGQSVAALSYVEPAAAILFSFLILGERLTAVQLAGCILVLGSTFVSELWGGKSTAAEPNSFAQDQGSLYNK